MPRWLPRVLDRIHALAAAGNVSFTLKGLRELAALDLGLDEDDACALLEALGAEVFRHRLASNATGEWMYVFHPRVGGTPLYVKVILRAECIVISFHEQVDDEADDEADA
jgi:hypothetical protein